MVGAIPPLVAPTANDLVGLLPEIVLGAAFIALMILDLFTPASRRAWLAGFAAVSLLAAFAVTVWGWFDISCDAASLTHCARTVYFGALAYDRLGLFVDGILIVSAFLVVLISPQYLNRRGIHFGEYYSLILAATVGMMLLASASSLMVIFLGIELLSLALYVLSGFSRTEERSQEAALKYLLLGGFASGFLLYGMALIYGETGHTQLAQIGAAVAGTGVDPLLIVGVLLLFAGLAFKVSAVPFHAWTPDVYQGAPTAVTAFMSVATKVAAFGAIIRVFSFTLRESSLAAKWVPFVAFVAIASMVVGNVAALTQTSVKRMLAYSGIAQAGYILIGVAVISPDATRGALFYLAAYTLTNLGAFAVITIMAGRGEDLDSYEGIRGLAFRRPYVAAAMGLFMLSLAGFPPTAGFFGKFFVFAAAVKNNQLPLALWGIATSALSVYYYLRVTLLMYSKGSETTRYRWSRTSASGALVVAGAAAGTLVFGVLAYSLYSAAIAAQVGTVGATQPVITAPLSNAGASP